VALITRASGAARQMGDAAVMKAAVTKVAINVFIVGDFVFRD